MKPNLFLLHFAGGNKYSFNFIKPYLKNDFQCFSLELPGRGMRLSEAFAPNLLAARDDLVNQILQINQQTGTRQFILYGHSLGGVLGLLVAGKLELLKTPPIHFVVSGNAGPGIKEAVFYQRLHDLPTEDFTREVYQLGGIPDAVFENTELMQFFSPILKADFRLLAQREPSYPYLNLPIHAIMGDQEECVNQIGNWNNFTQSVFENTILSGDHFFIYDQGEQIAEIIKTSLTNSVRNVPGKHDRSK